jgi:hypothetical protein
MKTILLGLCAAALTAGAAFAQADPMAGMYGNTMVVVSGTGMESHTVYSADHTFAGIVPSMGYKYQGTWALDDKGQLCRTFNPPVPGRTNPDCDPLTPHAVGDKWTMPDGGTVTITQGTEAPATAATPATPATPASN